MPNNKGEEQYFYSHIRIMIYLLSSSMSCAPGPEPHPKNQGGEPDITLLIFTLTHTLPTSYRRFPHWNGNSDTSGTPGLQEVPATTCAQNVVSSHPGMGGIAQRVPHREDHRL